MSIRSTRRRSATAVPMAITLALVVGVEGTLAESCVPTVGAFPPGDWAAKAIQLHITDTDDLSTLVMDGVGGFQLHVSDSGSATGTYQMSGQGYAQSFAENDESSSQASWRTDATLDGTATTITMEGETAWAMSGEIDVHTADGGPDPFSAGGQDLFGFENEFIRPFTGQFSPSAANCNTVFGSLAGPVEYGVADSSQPVFLAYRTSGKPHDADVQGQLAELMADAQFVLNMDPVDTDVLAQFVLDMISFDSLLASLESCDPGDELAMGATWQMLQSVMLNTIRTFLNAADIGAYSTTAVIGVIGVWAQGGGLGWRADDCLAVNDSDEPALDLLVKWEDVLLERLEIALTGPALSEIAQIRVAAYQYGLPRVIAALEAN
jgi:hypothetical protein